MGTYIGLRYWHAVCQESEKSAGGDFTGRLFCWESFPRVVRLVCGSEAGREVAAGEADVRAVAMRFMAKAVAPVLAVAV